MNICTCVSILVVYNLMFINSNDQEDITRPDTMMWAGEDSCCRQVTSSLSTSCTTSPTRNKQIILVIALLLKCPLMVSVYIV